MLGVLRDESFRDYYASGFVETGMLLPRDLTDRMVAYFHGADQARNDFPKFFENNEHQAYLNGNVLGWVMEQTPRLARKIVERLYAKTYERAVYGDQTFLQEVMRHLISQGLPRFFKTRYLVVGYDIFLGNDHRRSGAGIHTDFPTFHHFYETENDVTLYIPLVDLNEANGGRIQVLPEAKLKVAGNVLLKQMEAFFGANGSSPETEPNGKADKPTTPRGIGPHARAENSRTENSRSTNFGASWLDAEGYIDPDKIPPAEIKRFVASKPYQATIAHYKNLIALANRQYKGEFEVCDQSRGRVLLWNNKCFHSVEPWKNRHLARAIYILRLFPLVNSKLKLRDRLHGVPFNRHLFDTETGELIVSQGAVDVTRIPSERKLPL